MVRIFAAALFSLLMLLQATAADARSNLTYQAYVEKIGWQGTVSEGATAGTTMQGKRLEAIVINCNGVQYNAHVQDIGWQGWANSGQIAGTMNESKRIEAICIRLTGSLASSYDICYRVHVEGKGWMDWVRNGAVAGTTGKGLRVEAIQIRLQDKKGRYDYDDDDSYNRDRRGRDWRDDYNRGQDWRDNYSDDDDDYYRGRHHRR